MNFISGLSPVAHDLLLLLLGAMIALPLGIAANLLTPKIRNAWAQRSRRSLQNRITELTVEREKMASFSEMSEVEDTILSAIIGVASLSLSTVLLVVVLSAAVVKPTLPFLLVVVLILFLVVGTMKAYIELASKFWKSRSPSHRKRLDRNINDLKSKLDAWK
jgi:hypothetical protein